jgi:hypothetical protein
VLTGRKRYNCGAGQFFFFFFWRRTYSTSTRGVEAFLGKTAIAYHQNLAFLLGFRPYTIAVFFKSASKLRVLYSYFVVLYVRVYDITVYYGRYSKQSKAKKGGGQE